MPDVVFADDLGTDFDMGALTADKVNVVRATAAAYGLRQADTVSFLTNGYTIMDSGMIIQWGLASVPKTGPQTFTLPITFPTTFIAAFATDVAGTSGGVDMVSAQVANNSNIRLVRRADALAAGAVYFLAIGN